MTESRKSKVPFIAFGTTLEGQQPQLADNELMKRFNKSREELASDRYRPLYHFVSPEHSLNDPNGLCYWQEKWHLFYQGYPPEDPRQHWGHAVSTDLELDPMGANFVELNILRSPGKEEFTRIAFYRNMGYRTTNHREKPEVVDSIISLDTTYSSELPDAKTRLPENGGLQFEKGETLKLRFFIDRSFIEVFANGKQCVAERVYPGREDSTGVSIRSYGGDAKLLKLDAYQMKSIY